MEIQEIENLKLNETILLRNRDGSLIECRKVYFPLDYKIPTALVEIGTSDFREVQIFFLFKK